MSNTNPDQLKGASALLGGAMTYASFGLLIREMAKMFGNYAQVAFRFVIAFIVLFVWNQVIKRRPPLPRQAAIKSVLLGATFSVVVVLFTISVNLTTISNTVFLLYAGSIITSLFIGTIIFKEKLTFVKIAAIILALIGLGMYSSALLTLSLGVVAALICGIFEGIANGLRKTLKGVDRNTSLTYQFATASLITSLLLFLPETDIKSVALWPIAAGIIFGLLQISLGNLLLYGFQHFDVNVGSVILATELFFAILIGWVFFNEIPSTNELIGGVIIFFASILSAIDIPSLLKTLKRPRFTAS